MPKKGTKASRKKRKQESEEMEINVSPTQFVEPTPVPVVEQPVSKVPQIPKLGPDESEYQDSDPNYCTVIPFNCSIEEWASGVITLQEIPFKPTRKLPFEIYGRAKLLANYCKESKDTKGIFFGRDFENIFVVELPGVNYVCLTATTSKQKLQRNQLLHLLLSGDSKVPYGNALLLECEKTSTYLKYKGVGRRRAVQLLNRLLQDKMLECYYNDESIKKRFWDNDKLKQGTWFGTSISDFENINKWGLDSSLMLEHYKTHKCHRALQHEKKNCPFYHSLADARRSPLQFNYSEERCTASSLDCPDGIECHRSHNELEHYYHPNFFRRINCVYFEHRGDESLLESSQRQKNCKGPLCSFFHPGEMTIPVFSLTEDGKVAEISNSIDYTNNNNNNNNNNNAMNLNISNNNNLNMSGNNIQPSVSKNAWIKNTTDNATDISQDNLRIMDSKIDSAVTTNIINNNNNIQDHRHHHEANHKIQNDNSELQHEFGGYPPTTSTLHNENNDHQEIYNQKEGYPYVANSHAGGSTSHPVSSGIAPGVSSDASIFSSNQAPGSWGFFGSFGNVFPDTQGVDMPWRYGEYNTNADNIMLTYLNEIRAEVLRILKEFIKYFLTSQYSDCWLAVLLENCDNISPSNLSNLYQWDFSICSVILQKIGMKEGKLKDPISMTSREVLQTYIEYRQRAVHKLDYLEFSLLMKLIKSVKYDSKLSNFPAVESAIQKFEIKWLYPNSPYVSNLQTQMFQDYKSSTWSSLSKYIFNSKEKNIYILVGSIPTQVEFSKLFLSLPFSLILDFNVNQVGTNTRKQLKDPFKFYEATIQDFKEDRLDVENKITWLQMRSQVDLPDEVYSKNIIGGLADEVLRIIFKKITKDEQTNVICITVLGGDDLQYTAGNMMLKKHINHTLKTIYRFEYFNAKFMSLVEIPMSFVYFKEPILERSIEYMSSQEFYVKLCTQFEDFSKGKDYLTVLPSIELLGVDMVLEISYFYEVPVSISFPSEAILKESLKKYISQGSVVSWDLLFFEDHFALPKRDIFHQLTQTIVEYYFQISQVSVSPLNILLFKKSGSGASTLSRQIARSICLTYPTFFLYPKVIRRSKMSTILQSVKLLQSFYEKTGLPIMRIIDDFTDLELISSLQLNIPSITLFLIDDALLDLSNLPKNCLSISLTNELTPNELKLFSTFYQSHVVKSLFSNVPPTPSSSPSSSDNIPPTSEDTKIMNTLLLREALKYSKAAVSTLITKHVYYLLKPILKNKLICKVLMTIALVHRYSGESLPIQYVQEMINHVYQGRDTFSLVQFLGSVETSSLFHVSYDSQPSQQQQHPIMIRTIHPDVAELIIQYIVKEHDYQYFNILNYLLKSKSSINHSSDKVGAYNQHQLRNQHQHQQLQGMNGVNSEEMIQKIVGKMLFGSGAQRGVGREFSEILEKIGDVQAMEILSIADECFQSIDSALIKAKYMWSHSDKTLQAFNALLGIFNDIYSRCKTEFSDSFHLFYLLKGHLYADFLLQSINSIATNNLHSSMIQNIDDGLGVLGEIHDNACLCFQKAKACLMGRKYHLMQYILPYLMEFQCRFDFIIHYISIRIPDSININHPSYEKIDYVSSINIQFLELTFPINLIDYRNRCFELVYEIEHLLMIMKSNQPEHTFDPNLLCEREYSLLFSSSSQFTSLFLSFQKLKKKLFQLFGSGGKDFETLSSLSNLNPRSKQEIRRINIWNFMNDYRDNNYSNGWNENYLQLVYKMIIENLESSFNDNNNNSTLDSDMIPFLLLTRKVLQNYSNNINNNNMNNHHPILTLNDITVKIQHWVDSSAVNNSPIVANYYLFIVLFIEYIEFCAQGDPRSANYRSRRDDMKNKLLSLLDKCETILNENYYPNELRFYSHEFLMEGGGFASLCPISMLSKIPNDKLLKLTGKIAYSERGHFKKKESKCILFENIPIFCDTKLDIFKDDKYLNQNVTFNIMFSWRSPKAFNVTPQIDNNFKSFKRI